MSDTMIKPPLVFPVAAEDTPATLPPAPVPSFVPPDEVSNGSPRNGDSYHKNHRNVPAPSHPDDERSESDLVRVRDDK